MCLDASLSQKSCNIIVTKYLKIPSIEQVNVKVHLQPHSKELGINNRGKDKNWIVSDIAQGLINSGRVSILKTCWRTSN